MASTSVTGTTSSPQGGVRADGEGGSGWLLFAGIMIVMVGVLNVIYGIAAIGDASLLERVRPYGGHVIQTSLDPEAEERVRIGLGEGVAAAS